MAVELLEHAYLTDLVNLIHAEKSDANHLCVGRALPTFCRTVSSSSPPRMFRLECSDISTLQKRCLRPSCQVFDILGDRISCSLSASCVDHLLSIERERERSSNANHRQVGKVERPRLFNICKQTKVNRVFLLLLLFVLLQRR